MALSRTPPTRGAITPRLGVSVNLLLRLAWLLLTARRRPDATALGPCRTPFRVYPTDLDLLRHVNNGKYFSMMDLARVDLITRGGLTPHLARCGWFPVVIAETIKLRRPLRLLQRFHIETRVLGWDEQAFVLEQQFIRDARPVATALVRTCFLSRASGTVPPHQILTLLGLPVESPELPPHVARWNEDQRTPLRTRDVPHTVSAA